MKKRIYLIALPLLLAACTPNENPGTSNAVPSSKDETVYRESFTDILDAITYLKEQKNYTLDVRISRDGSLMEEFDINYTRDGYYFGIKNGEYGYKAISEGVFAYEIYGKEIYFSELLGDDGVKYTDLWSSGRSHFLFLIPSWNSGIRRTSIRVTMIICSASVAP